MSDSYTKLFRSITASTIVSEPLATRWLWVTLMSQADANGDVWGSVPGLARIANIALEECEAGLNTFLSPDPYSRTQEHDGRRIERIDGGWHLLNHAKYAAIRNEEERKEYKRNWDAQHRPSGHKRAKEKAAEQPEEPPEKSDDSPTVRQQSDADEAKSDSPTPPALTPALEEDQKRKADADAPAPSEPVLLTTKKAKATNLCTFDTFMNGVKARGELALPRELGFWKYAQQAGIPDGFILLNWRVFRRKHEGGRKTQAGARGWRQAFGNSVSARWYKLWYINDAGECLLTSQGLQEQRVLDSEQQEKAAAA